MERIKSGKRWFCWLACWLAGTVAWGALGGVGRDGAYVVEIMATGKEVSRSAGTWTVDVPKEMGALLSAAWVQPGTAVRLEEWGRTATLKKTESGWRSLELELKVPAMSGPAHAVEHLHAMPWEEFGKLLKQEMLSVAKRGENDYGAGLERALERIRTVFGGEGMVAGFPGTAYEREFRMSQRLADAVLRVGSAHGREVPEGAKRLYAQVFGAACPETAVGRFWSADGRGVEVREVLADGAKPGWSVFGKPLPLRIGGAERRLGVFPCGKPVQFRFGGEGGGEDRGLAWQFAEAGTETWFVLYGGEGPARELATRVENHGGVGVRATMELGSKTVSASIPANGAVALCLVLPPDVVPQFRAEGDPAQTPHPDDYRVVVKNGEGGVVVESARKEPPELILNNPEMAAVEVDVLAERETGRLEKAGHVRLEAGEVGVGLPATPHRAMELRFRFDSGKRENRLAVAPLGYGGRSNVVLKARSTGNPEVLVRNDGPVAVRLTGMAAPAGGVDIPPGKTVAVTVPAGKRAVLEGVAADGKYKCEAIPVSPMGAGEWTTASVQMSVKGAPQVVLRNTLGMMDAEATLMAPNGKPMAAKIEVKKGATSRPMSLPSQEGLYFRLSYRNGPFTAEGRLNVPAVPRGETKVLDIPDPTSEIRVGAPPKAVAAPKAVRPPDGRTSKNRP